MTLGGASNLRNWSHHKEGRCRQEISNKRTNEAESDQNHNTDKNNLAQNRELGDFINACDGSIEVFNNIPYSQSIKSDDVIIGELGDDDFMNDAYIAGLIDLEGRDSISGAQKCSFLCCKPFTEIDWLLQFRRAISRILSAFMVAR